MFACFAAVDPIPNRRESHFRSVRKRKLIPTPPRTPTPPAKRRPGKSSPRTSNLRKLAKDPTRRRFFEQCMKLDSLLFQRPVGNRKEEMDHLLFIAAAKGPIDEMFTSHGGTLRSVSHNKLQSIVKWQVLLLLLLLLLFTKFKYITN